MAVAPPGLATTVYPVIGLPPSVGAILDTVAERSCATAVTPVGTCGATGTTAPVSAAGTAATGFTSPAP